MSGSGFPSQAFSQIVRLLRNYLPMKPFLILVDADPYGIHIAWFHLKSIATRQVGSLENEEDEST
jgi:DNA topoisomerase VI subunit A